MATVGRRPIGVWVVFGFYLLSAGWTLLSFVLIFSGQIGLTREQQAYFASLTGMNWFLTFAIAVASLSACVCLFLLRRVAVVLFAAALALNFVSLAYNVARSNWLRAMGDAGLVGYLFGVLILLAVTLYARRLSARGVLS